MDTNVFEKWPSDRRIMTLLASQKQGILFVGDAYCHKMTQAGVLAHGKSYSKILFLRENATDLCHRADSFIIEKIKSASW